MVLRRLHRPPRARGVEAQGPEEGRGPTLIILPHALLCSFLIRLSLSLPCSLLSISCITCLLLFRFVCVRLDRCGAFPSSSVSPLFHFFLGSR